MGQGMAKGLPHFSGSVVCFGEYHPGANSASTIRPGFLHGVLFHSGHPFLFPSHSVFLSRVHFFPFRTRVDCSFISRFGQQFSGLSALVLAFAEKPCQLFGFVPLSHSPLVNLFRGVAHWGKIDRFGCYGQPPYPVFHCPYYVQSESAIPLSLILPFPASSRRFCLVGYIIF